MIDVGSCVSKAFPLVPVGIPAENPEDSGMQRKSVGIPVGSCGFQLFPWDSIGLEPAMVLDSTQWSWSKETSVLLWD